ncbi:MAG: hypothetical protein JJU28_20120 [Cyclobacteriaceae bacterium]|nr:hypothetical protein [Cyclobacteriaceae bacterium]
MKIHVKKVRIGFFYAIALFALSTCFSLNHAHAQCAFTIKAEVEVTDNGQKNIVAELTEGEEGAYSFYLYNVLTMKGEFDEIVQINVRRNVPVTVFRNLSPSEFMIMGEFEGCRKSLTDVNGLDLK